ncbi:MAG: DNA methyltransferase [Candidatus Hodarchaeales archaeon]|jgi:DNA modification methylase
MLTEDQLNYIRQFTSPTREKGYTRSIYSYPAKFLSHLPRELIKSFSKEGNQICDPFAGGGTTGLEAMLLNRPFIGYDINPFATLVSRVKTTYIPEIELQNCLNKFLAKVEELGEPIVDYFDRIDKECLGDLISTEINLLASIIKTLDLSERLTNFFSLALIHVVKIIGRRDFEERDDWRDLSMIPMFIRKCKKMTEAVSSLPQLVQYPPRFNLGSNHKMDIPDYSIDFILTSPPYLGIDVEYQQIQIQRRSIGKSKRTEFISRILRTDPVPKKDLCWTGKGGNVYWSKMEDSLTECHRILRPKHYLCLWTGFKNIEDQNRLINVIKNLNFKLIEDIAIPQSNNRAASSRSTHHSRDTKMLKQDSIFILRR